MGGKVRGIGNDGNKYKHKKMNKEKRFGEDILVIEKLCWKRYTKIKKYGK